MSFSEWDKGVIDDIANVTKLAGYEFTKHIKYIDDGEIIAIRALNVKDGVLDLKEIKRISSEVSDSLIRSKLFKDEILLTYTGSKYGEVAMVDEDNKYHLAPNVAKITIDDNYYPYFYFCYFRSETFKFYLKNYGVGSGQPTIPMKFIRRIEVPIPSLEEQINIAEIIKSIDKKIEVNNQINKTLENMAQAIFKQWLVDFEFPNENGEPYKSSGGKMVESELGMIPKGWEVKGLDEIAEFLNGLAMQKYRPTENEKSYPVLKIKELRQGRTDENSDLCSSNIEKKYIVRDGDIIFSWSGSLLVDIWCGGKCGLNQHLFKVTSDKHDQWFVYQWNKYHLDRFVNIAKSKATTMGHIKRKDLSDSKVLIPSDELYLKAAQYQKYLYNLNKMITLHSYA